MIGTQAGQLTIRQLLDESGVETLYLAEHAVEKTPCVVKVLPPGPWNPVAVQRYLKEARAAAALGHRNIGEVYGAGRLADQRWYLALPYRKGETLGQLLRAHRKPIPPDAILHIASEIANGLQAAHDRGIVHGDLRPDTIHLGKRDGDERRVTILGFGAMRLGDAHAGTPAYMAPEQLRGKEAGPAADVYALGVLVYQMTTGGRLPYQDEGPARAYLALPPAEIYHRQVFRAPDDPRRHAAGTSEAWVRAIAAALEVDPARRPAAAAAFTRMLAEALPGGGGLDLVRAHARELLEHPRARATAAPAAGGARYRLGPRLGAGGMAEVFAGEVIGAEGFARRVAIKRVRAERSEAPRFAALFIEEARIASRLCHPNVVSVLDFDRDPRGRLFLVMELVEGKDLAALCEAGPLPPPVAIFLLSELLRGLGYAHALPHGGGYVHRDLSPHNVLVSWEGAVKVSDFGIAKALEEHGAGSSGIAKGKPGYMSPEQVNGEPLDGRSDLFAAGILLWEGLVGQRLFTGAARETFAQILFGDVPPPSRFAPGLPADLEAVAMRLLARDRNDRYPAAAAAIDDLARCADHPRDGRGELVRWMAHRFPGARGSPAPAPPVPATATTSSDWSLPR